MNSPIFAGVQAIGDAGDLDGFVREVLARTKRQTVQTMRSAHKPMSPRAVECMAMRTAGIFVSLRLEEDLVQGLLDRVGPVAPETLDSIKAGPTYAAAMGWTETVLAQAMLAVFERLGDVVGQILDDAGYAEERTP